MGYRSSAKFEIEPRPDVLAQIKDLKVLVGEEDATEAVFDWLLMEEKVPEKAVGLYGGSDADLIEHFSNLAGNWVDDMRFDWWDENEVFDWLARYFDGAAFREGSESDDREIVSLRDGRVTRIYAEIFFPKYELREQDGIVSIFDLIGGGEPRKFVGSQARIARDIWTMSRTDYDNDGL